MSAWPEDNQFHEVLLWSSRKVTPEELLLIQKATQSIMSPDREPWVGTFVDFGKTKEFKDFHPSSLKSLLHS